MDALAYLKYIPQLKVIPTPNFIGYVTYRTTGHCSCDKTKHRNQTTYHIINSYIIYAESLQQQP